MSDTKTISLFVPCLVDQVYPEMGMAMVRILEHLGYSITYNARQTCCGQPAFNAGHLDEARKVARHFIDCFRDDACIVGPSGSCVAMVKNYYDGLFEGQPEHADACAVSTRIFEFSQFLKKEGKIAELCGTHAAKVAFHNSCHSHRELGITDEPFEILARIEGCEVLQPEGDPVCCGFGGLFMVKFPEVSSSMASARLSQLLSKGAQIIVSNDPGCIMNLRQEAKAQKLSVRILHLAEFLEEAILKTSGV